MRKCNVSLNKTIDLMFLLVSPSCHLKRSNIYGWGKVRGWSSFALPGALCLTNSWSAESIRSSPFWEVCLAIFPLCWLQNLRGTFNSKGGQNQKLNLRVGVPLNVIELNWHELGIISLGIALLSVLGL